MSDTRTSKERVAELAKLAADFFNAMPIEALKKVDTPLAENFGRLMVENGYRIVFNRWYLQAEPRPTPEPPADRPLTRTLRIDRMPSEEFEKIRAIADGTVAGSTFRRLLWQIEQLEAGIAELIAEPRPASPPRAVYREDCTDCDGDGHHENGDACPTCYGESRPTGFIDIVFDGPPSHQSGRFVEVEDASGKSINAGTWIDRKNGLWALRIQRAAQPPGLRQGLERAHEIVSSIEAPADQYEPYKTRLLDAITEAIYSPETKGENHG